MEHTFIDKELVFGVMSGRASSAINRKIYKRFNAEGFSITPEQWMVLQYLSLKDGISQKQLSEITFKDKTGITRMLDILERNKLIGRQLDPKDKRTNRVFLTAAGFELHNRAKQMVLEVMQSAVKGLSEEEIRMGERLLRRVFLNLE